MRTYITSAILGLATIATAAPAQSSFDSDVYYDFSVPAASASSGQGDIFFQIKGPTSRSWIGLGQGSIMANANIFVVYANAKGDNVTLSPRSSANHVEPQENSNAKVTLLSGSGIKDGMMVANIKCDSCNSWSTGKMSVTDSKSSWIGASHTGPAVSSDDKSADIMEHDKYSPFDVDLTKVTGGNSANPFAAADSTTPSTSSGSSTSGSSGAVSVPPGYYEAMQKALNVRLAHGTIMGLAFLFFFPAGVFIMRLSTHNSTVGIHAGVQLFAYALAIAGMGMGIWVALQYSLLSTYHAIIGLVTVCTLVLQPIGGILHHRLYLKHQRRTAPSYAHIWLGRSLMVLGAINGGLGLHLAAGPGGPTQSGIIAYGVLAGIVYALYAAVIAFTGRRKRAQSLQSKEMGSGGTSVDGNRGIERQ